MIKIIKKVIFFFEIDLEIHLNWFKHLNYKPLDLIGGQGLLMGRCVVEEFGTKIMVLVECYYEFARWITVTTLNLKTTEYSEWIIYT